MKASTRAFVEAASMEVFARPFVEATSIKSFANASGKLLDSVLKGKFHTFHRSFHGIYGSVHGSRGSFYGSDHELPPNKRVVQETGFVATYILHMHNGHESVRLTMKYREEIFSLTLGSIVEERE